MNLVPHLGNELLHEEDEEDGDVGVQQEVEGDEAGLLISHVTTQREGVRS